MGQEINNTSVKTWYIVKTTDNSIIHYECLEIGGCMKSGQPELETFTDQQSWIDRLAVLGKVYVDPEI